MSVAVLRHATLLIAASLLLAAEPARADERGIYMYKQHDGTRLYTDLHGPRRGHVYLGRYGRPTAYLSCNLTPAALQARGDTYGGLIGEHAAAYKVPAALVRAVMQVESCFDSRAVSRVGAAGLMQLMPGTAAQLGVADRFDAAQNIEGGVRYLSMMRERFPRDWTLALAAYNAGPEAVQKYGGVPPYRETRNYVDRVLTLYRKGTATAPPATAATATDSAGSVRAAP